MPLSRQGQLSVLTGSGEIACTRGFGWLGLREDAQNIVLDAAGAGLRELFGAGRGGGTLWAGSAGWMGVFRAESDGGRGGVFT